MESERGGFFVKLFELLPEEDIEDDVNFVSGEKEQFGFNLETDDDADDAMARILWAKSEINKNNALIDKKKKELQKQLDDYEKRLNCKLENYGSYYSELLRTYMLKKFDNKKGTLKLFHGNVRLKEPSATTEFDDEKALLDYIKSNNLQSKCVTVKESVRKTDLKKLFDKDKSGLYFVDANGDIVPGVHINKDEELKISITPAKVSAKG